METRFDLTPNFKGIFTQMIREARAQALAHSLFNGLRQEKQAEALREVQRFFAPLAVAAQAMGSIEELEQFRELMAKIIADVDTTAQAIENDLAEEWADQTEWEER